MKSSICRGCGRSYVRRDGISGRYCGSECKVKYPKSRKKCKPECSVDSLYIRDVVFKNGITHTQQCCRLCLKTTYLPRGSDRVEDFNAIFKAQSEKRKAIYGDVFYSSKEWQRLRYLTIKKYGPVCMCCKASGVAIHVDHIKPKSKYPELSLTESNLQILCEPCNKGKSNTDETDWRLKT